MQLASLKVQSSGQLIDQYFTINLIVSAPLSAKRRASFVFALLTTYWPTGLIKVEDSHTDNLMISVQI
jgi:hypothetical protein